MNGTDYWIKQQADKPAFSDLLWSRPENRNQAGKLLVIGGNSWGFQAPAQAYAVAEQAGIGTVRVLLPQAVHKVIGHSFDQAQSAPSTPSGSFSKRGLAEWLDQATWADGVLIAGDLGRNSETAILIEQFSAKYGGQLTFTKDAVDYALKIPDITTRPQTTLVLSLGQLQKLAQNIHFEQAITSGMDLIRLVDCIHQFQQKNNIQLVTKQHDRLIVAAQNRVSTTPTSPDNTIWRVKTAGTAAVWWLQHPSQSFEALTTAQITSND